MEPDGVGARDWKESLVLQAKAKGMKGDELRLFSSMVGSELENLRAGKEEAVARNLRTDTEEVRALYAFLKTLTPFPGRKYGSEYEAYIIPELSIKKDEDGILRMHLNRNALPLVEIDPAYSSMADEYRRDRSPEGREAEKFIKEKLSAASSLISQLDIRATTLEKTIISITVHGATDEDEFRALAAEAEKNCSIYNTIKTVSEMEVEIKFA